MNAATIIALVEILLDAAEKLFERGKQSGELTDEQVRQLEARAELLFEKFSSTPPPPA